MRSRHWSGYAAIVMMGVTAYGGTAFQPVDIRQVQTDGEIGRRIDITVYNNLLAADLDMDFLQPFRDRTAGSGYVGLGKTVDALARFAAYTEDTRVIEAKDKVIQEILALQRPDGYLGFFKEEARLSSLWDIHEMSYLIYGLITEYALFNNEHALNAAIKGADYIVNGWQARPAETTAGWGITEYMGATGIEPTLLRLYGLTKDTRYLDFCTHFRKLPEWDGLIVSGRWGPIQGHIYAYLSRCLAQLMLYDIVPEERLWTNTRKALDYMLRGEGLTIIGACGQHECWHNTQEGAANLGETCATAYAIRWWDDLLRREGNALYGDLMERAMYNALFGAQSPDGRRIRYYTPFEGPRVYHKGDTYCCPCNYRRIVSELPRMIYYQTATGIAVNLYTPSTATLASPKGNPLELKQDTAYPQDGHIRLTVNPSAGENFVVQLRMPHWASKPDISINDTPHDYEHTPGAFLAVERNWQPGDMVDIRFPMSLRLVKGREAQAGRAAVLYGPLVFTLNREKNPELKDEDLRMLTIDPSTLSGPVPDDSVHPGGLSCSVKAWRTTTWYPQAGYDWKLSLTVFADPGGEMTYFHVPNPNDPLLVDDAW
ncbi:MAG: Non-reducing end beta-L-arabinofuranosidase [Candidatus Hydrogenedentes bacterium ADurb.Bin101]|nr:MAG: Non-reducing end beta-L-arabinofuranosidase [Candidatus Hydrogenedentes bacterium ADurb.Bin101]HOC70284.1 glycoside hydrolase family 127 protein [Candidatus Hydrogenedentota bacterium]